MRTILVHLDEHELLPSVLATALVAARRFDAYVEGMFLRPGLPRMVPVSMEGAVLPSRDVVESLERGERELGRRLRARFDAFMAERGVPRSEAGFAVDHPTAGWFEAAAAGDDVLGSRGRAFDLIVVGRPGRGPTQPAMGAVEAALFETGRPVLIAPPTPPAGDAALGANVVVAWNGSTETARTIALAMPFLARAERVLVLSVEDAMVPGPSGADVARGLVRNGVPASARHIRPRGGGRGAGATMLEEAAAEGADLLVKGAFTQSRLRQMIFGGATSHILAATEIPVVMAH